MFFSIDGGDGTGKSTQCELFAAWLRQNQCDVVTCRDPGSSRLGESVRQLVLHRSDLQIHRRAEMLMYMAARAQLVEEFIAPALKVGKTVVSDRFLLANVVYQGHARGLDINTLWEVGHLATGGLVPDLTFVLDMPPEKAVGRIERELDRIERESHDFHTRVRDGFLTEARRQPNRIVVIDATRSIEQVQAEIRKVAESLLDQQKEMNP